MKRVVIAGGSGFLGRLLTESFRRDGWDVIILSRQANQNSPGFVRWDAQTLSGWESAIDGSDVVISLCGQSIATFPWIEKTKNEIRQSRLGPTRSLVDAIRSVKRPPKVFVQASGIDHYGPFDEENRNVDQLAADETSPAGDDFLGRLTSEWEKASEDVEKLGIRRIVLRTAPVLSRKGGSLPVMEWPVWLGGGAVFGSGRQPMAWIHEHDWVAAVRFLIDYEKSSRNADNTQQNTEATVASGPFNLIAPELTSNTQFNQAFSRALHRPCWAWVPASVLKFVVGEMSRLLLGGQYAAPKKLLELGFQFKYPTIDDAMKNLFTKQ